MDDASDTELLRQYADGNLDSAFAELVSRHLNLVYSAALRKTQNPQAAEEITQAVFILLAQKASSILDRTILAGWLYQATRFTAASFLKSEARRLHREQQAYMHSEIQSNAAEEIWGQLAPLLEDAMGYLGEKERAAVVLRYFAGKSYAEVATASGISENAAKKRVLHGLEKLRGYFARRGVSSTTAIIAGAISVNSLELAPPALIHSVTEAALAKSAAVNYSTSTLIKGALKIMAWSKAKTAAVTAVILVVTSGSLVMIHYSTSRFGTEHRAVSATEESFKQESITRMTQAKQWALVFLLYANNHGNQLPQNLEQLKSDAGNMDLSDSNWEYLAAGQAINFPSPQNTILLRDKEPRQGPDGAFFKVYAFADGHSQLIRSMNNDFAAFEKQHGYLTPSTRQ